MRSIITGALCAIVTAFAASGALAQPSYYDDMACRQYADSQRLKKFKNNVKGGSTVTTAMYDAGYGSSRSLYEKSAAQLGMTPATYGRGGSGMRIIYTTADCSLGRLLVAATNRGVCSIALGDTETTARQWNIRKGEHGLGL